MLLIFHVSVALISVVQASFLYFNPTKKGFNKSYILVGTTIGTGTLLVITTHSAILSSCLTGLAYLGIVSTAIVAARLKLAHQKTND